MAMNAVFIARDALLRDSQIDLASPSPGWRLVPATLEALRALADADTLVFLFGAAPAPSAEGERATFEQNLQQLVSQVEAGGGRLDGLITCLHEDQESCRCWGDSGGILWVAATQFSLHLEECYVIGDSERDVAVARAVGARPLVALSGRQVADVLGSTPRYKDFPVAPDLAAAVGYIRIEEEGRIQLGHARTDAATLPPDELLYGEPTAMPNLRVTSDMAGQLQAHLMRTRFELHDITRWLSFIMLGMVGLSLGVAYILTHLYREQPFPQYMYYLTLQFIPRPVRGVLFILGGLGIMGLAAFSFYRSSRAKRDAHL
jgi:histidinol phosphatase-like enzyme